MIVNILSIALRSITENLAAISVGVFRGHPVWGPPHCELIGPHLALFI